MARKMRYGLSALISSGSITSDKIANGAITNAKIAAGAAIDSTKLSAAAQGSIQVTAGQNTTAGSLLMFGDGSINNVISQATAYSGVDLGNSAGSMEFSQSITGADVNSLIDKITLRLYKQNLPTDNLLLQVRTGSETGPIVSQTSIPGSSLSATPTDYDITLATPVNMVAGTTYFIVLKRSTGLPAADFYWFMIANSGLYAGGILTRENAGSWSLFAGYGMYIILKSTRAATNVYLAQATTAPFASEIAGFATSAVSAGSTVEMQTDGVITKAGWTFSPGDAVYASNTAGAVSASAGTVARVVGRALTATTIAIDFT